MTYVVLVAACLLEFSHMTKIDVVVNFYLNTNKSQLVQYLIKLYVASKHFYFGLPQYVASFEVRCLVCGI